MRHAKECFCGSGNLRRALYDARGIFCTYVCDKCERSRRKEFNPEIFEDSDYDAPDLGYEV